MAFFESWFETNWFNLFQTTGIILGLLFTGLSLRRDVKGRHLSNLLALKEEHRELWSIIHEKPALARVLRREVDLLAEPMTDQEEIFLRQVIVHFAVSWELAREGTPFDFSGFRRDAGDVFSLPLPKSAWDRAKAAQNPKFVNFIEKAISIRVRGRPKL